MTPSLPGIAALLTGLSVMLVVRSVIRPPRRLGPRVRPYVVGSRTALGLSADVRAMATGGRGPMALSELFRPAIASVAAAIGRVVDRSSDENLALRLRQAGLFPGLADADRVAAHRLRQLTNVAGWTSGTVVLGWMLGLGTGQILALSLLGVVIGGTRRRGALDRAVDERRARMRIEIYTVNQLLAMRVRAGGGVLHAVTQVCARGNGEVVDELREALRVHRAGTRSAEAFRRIAELTPEPYCARTYALLAVAEDRGADLADALLSLSEDVREARREAIRRSATKRRAAMLVPTIAILAPVMLLFVGAPLPSLLLGFR